MGADGKRPCPAPSVRAFMVVRLRPRREAPTETVTFSRLRSPIPRTTTNLLSPGSATRDQAQCLHHGTSAPQAGFAPAGVPFPAPSGAPAGQSTKRGHAPAAQAAGWPHPTPQQRPTSRARSPTRTPPTRSYGRRCPLHSPPDSAFRVRYLDHDDPVPTAGTGPADSTRGPVPEGHKAALLAADGPFVFVLQKNPSATKRASLLVNHPIPCYNDSCSPPGLAHATFITAPFRRHLWAKTRTLAPSHA